jgi:hypothetical protein
MFVENPCCKLARCHRGFAGKGGSIDSGVVADVGLSLVCLEKSDRLHTAKLRAAIQDGDLKDEEVSDQIASQLLDERASSSSGTACVKSNIS